MKVLGLDLGSVTLGAAISDGLGIIANPIGTYKIIKNDLQDALNCVKLLVREHQVEIIVLGLPKNMSGTIGPQAEFSLQFKELIESELDLEVVMIDERLTSRMANQVMLKADVSRKKRKANVDKLAATIILQAYLDSIPKK